MTGSLSDLGPVRSRGTLNTDGKMQCYCVLDRAMALHVRFVFPSSLRAQDSRRRKTRLDDDMVYAMGEQAFDCEE